ncbi:hypothetical protein XM53_16380 [Roseovarius atlanticus]|uniref:Uncharacterized protein n=1 Tax=Roseovarius atlanticus TaxID=1641875 RepID=A0A0T5NRD6_9RHOB|nr:hypothetical protein [Roseovarius atlanticus]KRS11515.1 hypothetical protein XM53_16380 [Roseovarius atlanticus]
MTEFLHGQHQEGPGVLGPDAAARIKDATGLDLRADVKLDNFRAALNHLVQEASITALSADPRGQRRMLARLQKAYFDYLELARKLRDLDLYPPMPPVAWQIDTRNWLVDTNERLQKMGKRQSRPGSKSSLYPRTIGLFSAAFGAAPTIWYEKEPANASPLVRFVRALVEEARGCVEPKALGVTGNTSQERVDKLWLEQTGPAICEGLKKAKKEIRKSNENGEPGARTGSDPEWMIHAEFFSAIMGMR